MNDESTPDHDSIRSLGPLAPSRRMNGERGQAAVFLVLALGLFLIGGVGFVFDGTNLWFHRQSAQTAADAACSAAAMDLLSEASGVTPPNPNWISQGTTAFTCDGSMNGSDGNPQPDSGLPPCAYASLNGYSGSMKSVQVQLFGDGGFSMVPQCSGYSLQVCAADNVAATPYAEVDLTDTVQMTFARMLGVQTTAVAARARCGLSNVLSAVPITVLNPNLPDAMTGSGFTLAASFSASAPKNPVSLLQINSSNSDAVSSLSGTINLSNADGSKGNFSIAGQSTPSADGSYTAINAAGIVSDPFASIAPPVVPTQNGGVQPRQANGDCPATAKNCDIYTPGYWPTGLAVAAHGQPTGQGQGQPQSYSGVAVFEPGIYYLDGDFSAGPQTCLRPSINTGSGGVVFYFHTGTLQISAASGQLTRKNGFDCQTDAVPLTTLACPSSSGSNLPQNGISGNVLLAPCTGAYTDTNGNQQLVGDPLGTNDPIGEQRGILFFQDRNSIASPTWSSAGSFGLIGNIYFHHCGSGSGSGANCSSTAFDDTLALGSGSNSYIVGDIVVDRFAISGGSNIAVSLNPNPQYYVLKASLLQ